jgi:GMP synthase (glutamine-hydrolysing)
MADATLLILQHIACEPPAAYEDEMLRWGAGLHRVEVDEGEPLPDWRACDGIVAMGGPMGAYDDETLPWLVQEKQLIAEAVRADVPYWGVCLGSQLLAASLGAAVFPGPAPEVGVLPVELTDAGRRDPVFGLLPDRFPSLQWHSDTYDCPPARCAWPGRRPTSSRPSSYGVPTDFSSTSRCRCRWRPSGPPCPPTRAASKRWRAR